MRYVITVRAVESILNLVPCASRDSTLKLPAKIPVPMKDTTRIMRKPSPAPAPPEPFTLAGAMSLPRIRLHLAGASKDAVLRELAMLVVDPRRKHDVDTLVKALKAREKLCS